MNGEQPELIHAPAARFTASRTVKGLSKTNLPILDEDARALVKSVAVVGTGLGELVDSIEIVLGADLLI
jgi:hypothetical protein